MKPINLEHAFRQADRKARRRAYIDGLALRLILGTLDSEIHIACPTTGDAEALARDLKKARHRAAKVRLNGRVVRRGTKGAK